MSKNGSKALRNMLPNSRMDRQHRPKQFFRQKDRVEDFGRIEKKIQDKLEKRWDENEEAKKALAYMKYIEKEKNNERS